MYNKKTLFSLPHFLAKKIITSITMKFAKYVYLNVSLNFEMSLLLQALLLKGPISELVQANI